MTRLVLRSSRANSRICDARTPSVSESNLETSHSTLLVMQLPKPKPGSNYNSTLHSSHERVRASRLTRETKGELIGSRRRKLVPKARLCESGGSNTLRGHGLGLLPVTAWQRGCATACKRGASRDTSMQSMGKCTPPKRNTALGFPSSHFRRHTIFPILFPQREAGRTLKHYYFMISY